MKAVVQRAARARVEVFDEEGGRESQDEIGRGLMVLLGVGREDRREDAEKLAAKICALRIFEDEQGKMNLSVKDIRGEIMVVSQFTLFADTSRGNRPGFSPAAPPEQAIPLYEEFVRLTQGELGRRVPTGRFGAHMEIELVNDGPVTIILDTRRQNGEP